MSQRLKSRPPSVESDDHDQFFSAPASRIASPPHSETSSPSFVAHPITIGTLRKRWTIPLAVHHPSETGAHHHFPKPPFSRAKRGQPDHDADHTLLGGLALRGAGNPNSTPNTATVPLSPSPWSDIIEQGSANGTQEIISLSSPRLRRSPALEDLRAPYNTSRTTVDAIIRNVRASLSHRRHVDCSVPQNGTARSTESQSPGEQASGRQSDTYLITENDIADILKIVVRGLHEIYNEKLFAECLSRVLPHDAAKKPSLNGKSIKVGMSTRAAPATTVNSVQPTFSSTGESGGRTQQATATPWRPPRSTFISRQSVTEVK